MIALIVVLNFVISVFNSWSVGRTWVETRAAGGVARFMSWMGAVMAAVGFTWCYLVIIAYAATEMHKLPPAYIGAMLSLGYLAIVGPLIGSGIAITVESWAVFWRRRTLANMAIAGYNTFADVYNIYEASRYVPGAWDTVKDVLWPKKRSSSSSSSSDGEGGGLTWIVILLVVLAIFAGVLTAAAIIRTVSERTARERLLENSARSS
jgi:hypothetical protein